MDMILSGLNDRLVGLLGPMGPLITLGMLGVVMIGMTLLAMPRGRADPMDRLRRQTQATNDRSKRMRRDAGQPEGLRQTGGTGDRLKRYAAFLEPQTAEEMAGARLKMIQAGYRDRNAVRTLHAAQFGLGIGLMVLGVLYILTAGGEEGTSTAMAVTAVLGPAVIGYFLPRYWVDKRRTARQEQIVSGFPDALDMLLVCIEAGQSLDQSIMRVARELRAGYPALAEEFDMVSQEMKAGKERVAVLKDMSDRCGVTDVSSFVTVLVQSATFGTSIADALRVYASEMRDKRVMRAEEKANVLPTKLTLGTMMFTVPPLMIILVGPSVHGIIESFSQANF